MMIDRIVLVFAGCVLLLSLVLGVAVDQRWLFLALFVSFNVIQSAYIGFCPLALILRKLGARPGAAF